MSKEEIRFFDTHGRYCDDQLCYNNHSCNPNVMDLGNEVDIVVRDIKKGEEQTEDYRILRNKELRFSDFGANGCQCGEQNCMKKRTFRRPPSKELQRFWSKKINGALQVANTVKQPIRPKLLKEHKELSPLFDKWGKNKKQQELVAKLEKLRGRGPS
ncbi:MAG: hypothetical protein M1504_02540 [Candidatus Marsarchaeota archaeon]|nr:hypothetical protein [Candidatus Marsarchaeota archaeon]